MGGVGGGGGDGAAAGLDAAGASGPTSGWPLSVSGRRGRGPAVHTGRRGGGGGATGGIDLGSELSAIVGVSEPHVFVALAAPSCAGTSAGALDDGVPLAAITLDVGAAGAFTAGASGP